MKILCFGKTGQIATELARLDGAKIQFLSRAEADLTKPHRCAEIVHLTECDVIINAAAYTKVDQSEKETCLADLVNGTAVTRIAEAAACAKKPFIHISTDYVFDGTLNAPWKSDAYPHPLGAYGQSKLLGEAGIIAAHGPFAILRTSWVFSLYGDNFVKTILKLAQNQPELTVVDDQIGRPTPAADIASVLIKMAEALYNKTMTSGIYHFAGWPDTSWAGFAKEIVRAAKADTNIIPVPSCAYPTATNRPKNSRLNCSKIFKAFGVKRPDWRSSLKSIVSELKV